MMILDLDTAQPLNKCTSRKGADEGHPYPKHEKERTTHRRHPALSLLDCALAEVNTLEGHHDSDDGQTDDANSGCHA